MGARVDTEQLVARGQAVDQAQVAAAVHVLPAGEDIHRHGDAAHLRQYRALLVDGPVIREEARLDRELLLSPVERLRLRTEAERLRRRLPREPLPDEAL